jgi:O-antigen/teichoic acid export membrane protein
MASAETTSLLDDKEKAPAASAEGAKKGKEGWKPSAIAADIATLGTGTLLAGLFNVALVFVVPKLLSLEDYGYWRLFGLYAGYVGFLHLGLADGALLRWAGRPMEEFCHEIGPGMKFLFWQHVIVLVPLCAIVVWVLPAPLRFVVIAVAIYALIFNIVTIQQYALQAARVFRPVAISTVAAPALFLAFVLLWRLGWQSNSREMTSLYAASWLIALVFLLAWTRPWSGLGRETGVKRLAAECVKSGWAVLAANGGVMLIASADRLVLSWAVTIQNFAQYSLAASAMAVPITAIQACSKVFFAHLAGVTPDGRKRIYGISSRTLLIAWALLLPYYFALDVFIRHVLANYIPSLIYARILLLGIPFLAAVQILQTSYAYLHGMQKRFFVHTTGVLVVSLATVSAAAFGLGSLRLVAGMQVVILGGWWLFNEWTLRSLTGQTIGGCTKFLGIFVMASTNYWLTTGSAHQVAVLVLVYYLFLVAVLVTFCQEELRLWVRLMRGGAVRQVTTGGAG